MEHYRTNAKVLSFERRTETRSAGELFNEGQKAEERHDGENAIRLYCAALREDPTMAAAHLNLGTIYLCQGKLDPAERHMQQALVLDPGYALAHFNLGICMEKSHTRDSEAMMHYRVCLDLWPDLPNAHLNLAGLCEKHELNREAMNHYKLFLKHAPTADPHRRIAKLRLAVLQLDDFHLVNHELWTPNPIRPRSRSARRRNAREHREAS